MGTKAMPAKGDCYSRALPDEPIFTLLARDPVAPAVIKFWAVHREVRIARGEAPESDSAVIEEAIKTAYAMGVWRTNRLRSTPWRAPRVESDNYKEARRIIADALSDRFALTSEAVRSDQELTTLEHNAVEALALLIGAAYEGTNGESDLLVRRTV